MRKNKIILSLFALILTIVILVGCNLSNKTDESYVTLDINPSVEMVLNNKNKVEYVNALNSDADVLLTNLDLEGKDVEDAIDEIIDESTDLGFINPEATETTIEVGTTTEDGSDTLGEKIRNHINNAFTERGMYGYGKQVAMTSEIITEAETLGIAPGKLRLIKSVQTINPDLTTKEAIAMSVKDLTSLLKEKGNEIKNMTKELKDQFFAERNQIIERYQPQIADLRTQIADLESQIEAETDETAKAQLETQLADLQTQLDDLIQARNQEIAEVRNNYQSQIEAKRNEIKAQHQAKIEEHKAKVNAFRQQFEQNKKDRQEKVEQWQNQHQGKGK